MSLLLKGIQLGQVVAKMQLKDLKQRNYYERTS